MLFAQNYDLEKFTKAYPKDKLKSTDIQADPQLIDPLNGDFRIKAWSPCRNNGLPTLGDLKNGLRGFTSIGAYQPDTIGPNPVDQSTANFLNYWLSDDLQFDHDENGIINFVDFSTELLLRD